MRKKTVQNHIKRYKNLGIYFFDKLRSVIALWLQFFPSRKYRIVFITAVLVFSSIFGGLLLLPKKTAVQTAQIVNFQSEKMAVLGEQTQAILDDSISFNILSEFNEKVIFKKDIEIEGTTLFTGNIAAPNVLYSLAAGDGISLTTGQSPKITNSGVLSLGSKTGALSLEAGSNITDPPTDFF